MYSLNLIFSVVSNQSTLAAHWLRVVRDSVTSVIKVEDSHGVAWPQEVQTLKGFLWRCHS